VEETLKGANTMAERQLTMEEKWALMPLKDLVMKALQWGWLDIFLFSRVLIDKFGKEEASRLIEKARVDYNYKRGRAEAEKLGNPQGVDAYMEKMLEKQNLQPLGADVKITERTKNKVVFNTSPCIIAEAYKALAADPRVVEMFGGDAIEVAKAHCTHDRGWANGFDPKMKFQMTKFLLDGDDLCEFVAETEE
jgi:hypothetical protein